MLNYELVLLKNVDDPRITEIDHYLELGGYAAARKGITYSSAHLCPIFWADTVSPRKGCAGHMS